MNKNFSKAFKKSKQGNYFGYCNGYYIFIYKRPHGRWCCRIGRKGKWFWQEGYFGTSLDTVSKAKQWAKFRVVPDCITEYTDNL